MSTTELTVIPAALPAPAAAIPERRGFDLLRLRPVAVFVRWAGFPYVFQAGLLAIFVFFAVFGWGIYTPKGIPDKLYGKSNIVNLMVWGLWWPAMVWTAVLLGRAWCAVCPLEMVANGTERFGRLLGKRQRVLGKWLRSGALIIALYGLIQALVAGAHIHRIPAYTSLFLWGLLALAGVVGFLFKDRAFCRGFCPVGLLLGTYGRGAMLAVRPKSTRECGDCTAKDCALTCNRSRLDSRSCPSLLNPARLNSSADCLVCGQCVKVCHPDNMGLFLRPPFAAADARERLATWPVTLFVMLVSGFVTSELMSEWPAAQAWFLMVPEHAARFLGAEIHAGWLEAVWVLLVVPGIAWLLLASLVLAVRGAAGISEAWRRLALPLAVVVAAGHMCKGLAKFVSWIGFLPLAASDPVGVNAAAAINAKTIAQPAAIIPMPAVSVIAMVLVLCGAWLAFREARLAQREGYRGYYLPLAGVAASFLFVVFGWGFLR
jgi:polyferredoxin